MGKQIEKKPVKASELKEGDHILSGARGIRTLSRVQDGRLETVMTGRITEILNHCRKAGIRLAAVQR